MVETGRMLLDLRREKRCPVEKGPSPVRTTSKFCGEAIQWSVFRVDPKIVVYGR